MDRAYLELGPSEQGRDGDGLEKAGRGLGQAHGDREAPPLVHRRRGGERGRLAKHLRGPVRHHECWVIESCRDSAAFGSPVMETPFEQGNLC
jgi:hypothetical protein